MHSVAVAGRADALRAMALFRGCADEDLQRLAESSRLRRFARGQSVIRAQQGEACVVLAQGRVKTSIPREDIDGELIVDIHSAGDLVADACWTSGDRASSGDAIAMEASTVFFLPRRAIGVLLERDARVATRLIEIFATKHARAAALAVQNACLGVGERLYCRIVELAHTRGRATSDGILIAHGLTQRELGAFSSASRENVNRQLNEWQARGWLEIRRHSLQIRDADAMSQSVSPTARRVGFGVGDGRAAFRVA